MREILFRGKRWQYPNWVLGVPFYAGEDMFMLMEDMSEDEEVIVIRKTVGQYIGR